MMVNKRLPNAIATAHGLTPEDATLVRKLIKVWQERKPKNDLRSLYYLGKEDPQDLCIAVPPHLRNLRQSIDWSHTAVDALASRSRFDSYVSDNEEVAERLRTISQRNNLVRSYAKAVISELIHGTSFIAVSRGIDGRAVVRCFPATAGAAVWNQPEDRIKAGLVIVDTTTNSANVKTPCWVNLYTDTAVVELKLNKKRNWEAQYFEHGMGRPTIEPFSYQATLERPFGRSRITQGVMDLTDDAIRASRRAEIAAEFAATTQKYLLGAPDEVFDGRTKWDAALDTIFAVTRDENGDIPTIGQFTQPSMQPHVDYFRSLAARFASETHIPVSMLGVYTDANPQSFEAMRATSEPLIIDAQNLNMDNARALVNIGLMSLATENGTSFEEELAKGYIVQPHFKDPSMPSTASESDGICKQVSSFPWMQWSDVPLEKLGYGEDSMIRLRSDRARVQSQQTLAEAKAQALVKAGGATDDSGERL